MDNKERHPDEKKEPQKEQISRAYGMGRSESSCETKCQHEREDGSQKKNDWQSAMRKNRPAEKVPTLTARWFNLNWSTEVGDSMCFPSLQVSQRLHAMVHPTFTQARHLTTCCSMQGQCLWLKFTISTQRNNKSQLINHKIIKHSANTARVLILTQLFSG